jgi:hypothetical protein
MSGDLVAFLNARLDEDDAAAKAWLPFGNPDAVAREHIARHDPGRVLREVAAKRAIVGLHRIEVRKAEITPFDPYTGERRLDQYEVTCEICGWSSDDPTSACATLRAIAAVYSHHPDYREEWKV